MLTGGGFIFDGAFGMPGVTERAVRAGFEPHIINYPEFDLPGAVVAAETAAKALRADRRVVYAYGESAGGTLAARLVQSNLVAAAATYSPVANLRRFADHLPQPDFYMALIHADRELLVHQSPGLRDSDRPILALRPVDDARFMTDATRKWDERDPEVRSVAVPGAHLGDPDRPRVYRRNFGRAISWIKDRTTLSEACSSRR